MSELKAVVILTGNENHNLKPRGMSFQLAALLSFTNTGRMLQLQRLTKQPR